MHIKAHQSDTPEPNKHGTGTISYRGTQLSKHFVYIYRSMPMTFAYHHNGMDIFDKRYMDTSMRLLGSRPLEGDLNVRGAMPTCLQTRRYSAKRTRKTNIKAP